MVTSEFALLQRSSVVTLSVAGTFKEIITISAAAIIFGDPLTPVNISGLAVTIVSVGWYNWWKVQKMRSETLEETTQGGVEGGGDYVAVGEEDVDVDVENASSEEDEEERIRRERKFAMAKAKAQEKRRVKGKGKGKARAGIDAELLSQVDELEDENSAEVEAREDDNTIKQGAVPSGSATQAIILPNTTETASLKGEVRGLPESHSVVEEPSVKNSGPESQGLI